MPRIKAVFALCLVSFTLEAGKYLHAPFQGDCDSYLRRAWQKLRGDSAPVGYRGTRGAFAFARRTSPGEPPVLWQLSSQWDGILSNAQRREALPPELQDPALLGLIDDVFILAESSRGTQNMSPRIDTAYYYAAYPSRKSPGELHDFNYVLGAEMKASVKWGRDLGFYLNDSSDKELQVPAEDFLTHAPHEWVVRVRYGSRWYPASDPLLPPKWKSHLAFAQEAAEYMANLASDFSFYTKEGKAIEQNYLDFLRFFAELRKKYGIENHGGKRSFWVPTSEWD
jgi:hypothetical protein